MSASGGSDTTKTWLNANQQQLLWSFYHEDAVVQLCRSTILRTLLNGGVVITARGGARASPNFKYVIDTYWVPFICDVFDALTMWGIAVYAVRSVRTELPTERTARKVRVPFVVPYGAYKLEIRRGKHAWPTYHVYRVARSTLLAADSHADSSLRVLLSPTYRPTLNGLVRSPLLPLMPLYDFSQKMHRYAAAVEHLRSHPPLICETRPEKARRYSAEHLFRLNALLVTAVTCIFIPAECSAVS